jgi:hypothetical protein
MLSKPLCRKVADYLWSPEACRVQRLNRTWKTALSEGGTISYLSRRVMDDLNEDMLSPTKACRFCGNWAFDSSNLAVDRMEHSGIGQAELYIRIRPGTQAVKLYFDRAVCDECAESKVLFTSLVPLSTDEHYLPNARRISDSPFVFWCINPALSVRKEPISISCDPIGEFQHIEAPVFSSQSGSSEHWWVEFRIRMHRSRWHRFHTQLPSLTDAFGNYNPYVLIVSVFSGAMIAGFVGSRLALF